MEDYNLFDEKEFYLQPNQPDLYLKHTPVIESQSRAWNLLVREWNGETWQFGSIKEVQIPRSMKAFEFAKYL
jgi:hypothetical protein